MLDRRRQFPTTLWSRIRAASSRDESAMREFVLGYREPVRRFLCARGLQEADAEDLVQEVFCRVLSHGILAIADEAKGRFRSLLLAVTRSILSNWRRKGVAKKRGGGRVALPLDPGELAAAPARDPAFDREWLNALLERAMERLRGACEQRGLRYHAALTRFVGDDDPTHASLARELGATEAQVRNWIHRGRRLLLRCLREEVLAYSSSREEFREEAAYFAELLENQGGSA